MESIDWDSRYEDELLAARVAHCGEILGMRPDDWRLALDGGAAGDEEQEEVLRTGIWWQGNVGFCICLDPWLREERVRPDARKERLERIEADRVWRKSVEWLFQRCADPLMRAEILRELTHFGEALRELDRVPGGEADDAVTQMRWLCRRRQILVRRWESMQRWHWRLADRLCQRAFLLHADLRPRAAERLYRKAMKVRERAGATDAALQVELAGLAGVCRLLGRRREARRFERRLLRARGERWRALLPFAGRVPPHASMEHLPQSFNVAALEALAMEQGLPDHHAGD